MQAADIMSRLLDELNAETRIGRPVIPMAALCKRLDIRMSTLQRHLTALAEYDLVEVHCAEAGRWTTLLTPAGLQYMAAAQAA